MKLYSLTIKNFRSIKNLEWNTISPFNCLIGKGDIGKSTILDAIELVLSARRGQIFDTDFFECCTDAAIEISAVVGQLPTEAFEEARFAMHLRGLAPSGELHDEPKKEDEPVVTVRLTVEQDLEPRWELITDRLPPKPIFAKDRALFGLVRLGAETDSHLTWSQYSTLARLTAEKETAFGVLTKAFRHARETVSQAPLAELNKTAAQVQEEAARLGAYHVGDFCAGLDTQRMLSSLSALALHSVDVPLRLSGLGTRRLSALAVQRLSIPEGAIILIDELEHGLEPHRIRHALKVLREDINGKNSGQIIITTHSATTIVELIATQLAVVTKSKGSVVIRIPTADLQAQLRKSPEAFLSKKVLVCEGKTEIGMCIGLHDLWAKYHDGEPFALRGTTLANGDGGSGPIVAECFAKLGYSTLLFRDSDVPLTDKQKGDLKSAGVRIIEWADKLSTEQQVFLDISAQGVQRLLDYAYLQFDEARVLSEVASALGVKEVKSNKFVNWIAEGLAESKIRNAIAYVSKEYSEGKGRKGWFKRIDRGEALGNIVADEISQGLKAPLVTVLDQIHTWAYAD